MDAIQEFFRRSFEELLGRVHGPLHFRLAIMPIVAASVAIRAGLRDVREGRRSFILAVVTARGEERQRLRRSWRRDLGRVLIVGFLIDTVYQIVMFRAFYPGQALIVTLVLAVLPYLLFRSPMRWILHALHWRPSGPAAR
ncbi:MAG: hypothetical protein H6Q77_2618 [Gemmatimonadetes bacterium]|nr:hypothetical protein [Gemmatimonadota bacterium]